MDPSSSRPGISTVSGNEISITSPTSISPHMTQTMARRGPMYQLIPDAAIRESTSYSVATLPRTQSPYGPAPVRRHAKTLQAVATVAHKYLSLANKRNSSMSMHDEEMTYLRAIERGDIDEVKQILSVYDVIDEEDKSDEISSDLDHVDVEFEVKGSQSRAKRTKSANEAMKNGRNMNKRPSLHVEGELPFIVEMKPVKPNSHQPSPSLKYRDSKLGGKKRKRRKASTDRPRNKEKRKSNAAFKKGRLVFDKNCRDQWGRTGLFIATSRRNLDMIELLLDHKVSVDECLYHAIDFGFYDVVELLLSYSADRDQVISGEDSFYPPGLTPIQLAAHKNDFIMLKILHNKGFRIMAERGSKKKRVPSEKRKDSDSESDDNNFYLLEKAWDQSNDRMLYYRAMSSPAYLIMMHTEGGFADEPQDSDFLDRIFRLYGKLKKKASREPDARTLYLQLASQVEGFACDLLNEVRTAEDLSNLLRFDPPGHVRTTLTKNHLLPMQTACEVKMKNFVAHQHCQLSLSILRIGTLFDRDQGWKTFLTRALLAIMFPILCLVFIVAPDSWFGSFLRNPMVNLSCHIVSDITFLILMIIRLILKSTENLDCLGTPPNGLEVVILSWVFARIVNEIKKAREVGVANLFSNVWRMNDFATLLIFFVVICLRTVDIVRFSSAVKNVTVYECNRTQWRTDDATPILVSEGLMSAVYLLIFIRTLEKMYIDRTFGPLQLSLDKMLLDIVRFLIIFLFTFCAFACGMVQLYWSYYQPLLYRTSMTGFNVKVCEDNEIEPCYPVYATILGALLEQFWTIFGYGYTVEPPQALKTPDEAVFTEGVGLLMSGLFHAWAVVVMLNMLIAMMSHSFDRVRDNAEVEWKFHRTHTWMKFIRKGIYPRPPPMNLIPSPRDITSLCQSIKNAIQNCCKRRITTPQRRMAQRADHEQDPEVENSRYRVTLNRVTERYLRKHLLEEFQHEDDTPLLLQQQTSKNTSPRKLSSIH